MDTPLLFWFCLLGGLFTLTATILNWDWFFANRRARPVVALLGRGGARVFYGFLGVFITALAWMV